MRQWPGRTGGRLRRALTIMCAGALGVALTVALTQQTAAGAAPATRHTPPSVPANLEVPAGNSVFLVGHATGTQQYVCLGTDSGIAWTFFGPQATLFNDHGGQVTTHFLSANPDEGGTARPTWQHSSDTSSVWAASVASSSDPNFVEPGAIPWLLLDIVGDQPGPTGGNRLAATTYIQRVHTTGGTAPASGCATTANIGAKALVPYTADYYFYRAR